MKIDKENMDALEKLLLVMLGNVTKGTDLVAKEHAIDVSLKLSQLLLNIKSMQGADTQEALMEKMQDIDFSNIDINNMLQGIMKGEM